MATPSLLFQNPNTPAAPINWDALNMTVPAAKAQPMPAAKTLVKDPVTGAFAPAPTAAPSVTPTPTNTPDTQSAPAQKVDPYTQFNLNVMDMLKQIQNAQTAGNMQKAGVVSNLKTQSVTSQGYNPQMTPDANIASIGAAPSAFGPAISSNEELAKATDQSLNDLGSKMTGLASIFQNQNVALPYNEQLVSKTTGQPLGGGTIGSLPPAGQQAVQLQIQRVKSGMSTISDAAAALGAYGQPGLNALQEGLGGNFNVNASNASAATTGVGQQLQTAATAANGALDKLMSDYGALGGIQTKGIPLTNNIANHVQAWMGQSELSTYQTTLADARAQLEGVLSAAGGITPTGAQEMAETYLPDNMTPTQLTSKVKAVKILIAQKVAAFTNSGQQQQVQQQIPAGSGLYNF